MIALFKCCRTRSSAAVFVHFIFWKWSPLIEWILKKKGFPQLNRVHSGIHSKDLIAKFFMSAANRCDSFLLPDAPWKQAIANVSLCCHAAGYIEMPVYVHYPQEIHFKIWHVKISIIKMKRSRVVFVEEPPRGWGHCNYRNYWLVFSKVWSIAVK